MDSVLLRLVKEYAAEIEFRAEHGLAYSRDYPPRAGGWEKIWRDLRLSQSEYLLI